MDRNDRSDSKPLPRPDAPFIGSALGGEKQLQFIGRQAEGLRIDIDKHRFRSHPGNTAGSREKGKRRRDDRVTRSDPQSHQNQQFGIGTG